MKKFFWCLASMTILLTTGGCWLLQHPAPRPDEAYDLAPAAKQTGYSCRFSRIRNLSPAGRKMLCRHADNRISESPASWVQDPESLLARYLAGSFPVTPDAPQISVTILRFELDLARSQAVLSAELAAGAKIQRRIFTADLQNTSGADASRAMTLCAEKLVQTIITMIQEK